MSAYKHACGSARPAATSSTLATAATSSAKHLPDALDWRDIERAVYLYADSNNLAARATAHALKIVEDALQRYGMEGLSLSFNGGKDCTVLLHLCAAAFSRFARTKNAVTEKTFTGSASPSTCPCQLYTFYVLHVNSFLEESAFVEQNAGRYQLHVCRMDNTSIRPALQQFLENHKEIKGVLVGTRRTDPHGGNLKYFTLTDPGYVQPRVMRIHPVIDWSYEEVWSFLRDLNVPYCAIYDKGYTSLGDRLTTQPNPALRNLEQPCGYDPAWMLAEATREREGRGVQKNQ